MRRFAVGASVVSALAVAATLALGAMTGAAFAVSHVTCKKLTGTVAGSFTVTTCSPFNAAYKSASAKTTSLASGSGTLKWAPSGKTTMIHSSFTNRGQGGCALGSQEYDVAGSVVKGGTATYTPVGDVVKGRACLSGTGSITLVPGTSLSL
jgi:hypothetical protein